LEHLGCQAEVICLDPHSLDDVFETILVVGARMDVAERAQALVAGLRQRLDVVARAVAGRGRPRVAVVEWVDPPFSAGHWVPDLVWAAGGEPVAAHPHERSVQIAWRDVVEAAPDLVLVAPCGFHLDGAVAQAREVVGQVPGVPVWAIDADGIVVRPGPRLVDGIEALASLLHPGAVPDRPGTTARVA
jgi:iron complex transport system substrate-binding protein